MENLDKRIIHILVEQELFKNNFAMPICTYYDFKFDKLTDNSKEEYLKNISINDILSILLYLELDEETFEFIRNHFFNKSNRYLLKHIDNIRVDIQNNVAKFKNFWDSNNNKECCVCSNEFTEIPTYYCGSINEDGDFKHLTCNKCLNDMINRHMHNCPICRMTLNKLDFQ